MLTNLIKRANRFFKLSCIDDNVVGLPENEYFDLTDCRFCGRKLHRRRHLFTDAEEGIAVAGKRCPYCGTIYTTHRILYVLITAYSPEKLELLYSWGIAYKTFTPIKDCNNFLDRDDVVFVEGKHSSFLHVNKQTDKHQEVVPIKKYSKKNDLTKEQTARGKGEEKSCIKINNHPVIRVASVVVIDDTVKYKTDSYAIQVMSKVTGKIFVMIIDADYNSDSGHYFISKETYDKLFVSGIPLCRLIKKKDYAERMKDNDLDLKPQSILMEYGYNVSEQNGLSMLARHNILSMLIDAGICTKTRIINYLEFFIKQRQSNQTMQDAISKWEDDICYVNNYTEGTLKKNWSNRLEVRG